VVTFYENFSVRRGGDAGCRKRTWAVGEQHFGAFGSREAAEELVYLQQGEVGPIGLHETAVEAMDFGWRGHAVAFVVSGCILLSRQKQFLRG
jgi:hypothetical protein